MTDDPRDLATDAEWLRHERFLNGLKERGRRMATLEAYDKDWRALARWYLPPASRCSRARRALTCGLRPPWA